MDRGANIRGAGKDVRFLLITDTYVDVEGINQHQVNDINIGSVTADIDCGATQSSVCWAGH